MRIAAGSNNVTLHLIATLHTASAARLCVELGLVIGPRISEVHFCQWCSAKGCTYTDQANTKSLLSYTACKRTSWDLVQETVWSSQMFSSAVCAAFNHTQSCGCWGSQNNNIAPLNVSPSSCAITTTETWTGLIPTKCHMRTRGAKSKMFSQSVTDLHIYFQIQRQITRPSGIWVYSSSKGVFLTNIDYRILKFSLNHQI